MTNEQITVEIEPQNGFQWDVLSCEADVAIIGGSAGCGKTWTLLLDPVRDLHVPGFYGIIFRRENVQIFTPGGLYDKGVELYGRLPAPLISHDRNKPPTFSFPTGSKIVFGHLNKANDVNKYQGSEIPYIAFDELTHFDLRQFIYMLTRNRTTCGVRPRIRASCNPQGEGWVKDLIQWWLHPDDHPDENLQAAPRLDRRGVIRYFAAFENQFMFGDTREEVYEQFPANQRAKFPPEIIKSITFIGGTLEDNPILTKSDPGYIGGLMAQGETDRVQLLEGRWINIDLDKRRLYEDAELHDVFTNTFVEEDFRNRYLTADVALEGADLFVIGIWHGWVLVKIYTYEILKPEEVAPLLKEIAKKHRIPESNIAYDAVGVGALVAGTFTNAFPIVAQATPLKDKTETGEREESQTRPNYTNLRSQLCWKLKQVLADREMFIAVNDVDLQKKIIEESREVRKVFDKRGRQGVNPKDEISRKLGRSPDHFDMIYFRCAFEFIKPLPKAYKRKVRSF